MPAFLLFFFFSFGSIIGSFLNVVILRYGTKKLSGRSLCFTCGKLLHWYELVPILSFCLQRGRCRGCVGRISWQYPLVECITGLVFAFVAWKELPSFFSSFSILHTSYFILLLALWSLLIALSVYDIKHKIIPNALVYSACFVSLLILLFSYRETYNLQLTTYNFFSGFLFATPFALLWFFSKGRAIGLGDAKLIVLFPWFLGLAEGLTALIVGFWIGAGLSLGLLLLKAMLPHLPKYWCPNFRSSVARLTLKTELPLGPFLVLGLFLVYVFGWDVTGLSLLLQ
ncbi:MAG: prepilin peptidase [Candidatus Taylorbacteria bacterium]|nr:prepilin peptidase [Candidatus Taylorbacteria bacterium]